MAEEVEQADPPLTGVALFHAEYREQLGHAGQGRDGSDQTLERGRYLHLVENGCQKGRGDAQMYEIFHRGLDDNKGAATSVQAVRNIFHGYPPWSSWVFVYIIAQYPSFFNRFCKKNRMNKPLCALSGHRNSARTEN